MLQTKSHLTTNFIIPVARARASGRCCPPHISPIDAAARTASSGGESRNAPKITDIATIYLHLYRPTNSIRGTADTNYFWS